MTEEAYPVLSAKKGASKGLREEETEHLGVGGKESITMWSEEASLKGVCRLPW